MMPGSAETGTPWFVRIRAGDTVISVAVILMIATGLAAPCPTLAEVRTWTGGSSKSGAWDLTANWSAGAYPVNGDDVVFPMTASRRANTNVFTKLRLNSITFSGAGYEIRGNAIVLSDGLDSTAAGSVNTIDLNIDLGASQTFDCSASTAALYVNANIDLGSYTLTMMGPGAVRITGVISGTGGLTKTGTGTHWLQGSLDNTYTGPTLVGQGTLMLAKPGGASVKYGSLTVGNGAGGADTATARELGNYQIGNIPVTVNSDGWLDVGNYYDTVGSLTFSGGHAGSSASGTLAVNGDITVDASSQAAYIEGEFHLDSSMRTFDVANGSAVQDLYITSAVIGTGGLTKTGPGSLWLYGNSTYTGETMIDQGVVHVISSGAFGDQTDGTTVSGTGSIQLDSTTVGSEPLTLDRPAASGTALSASGTSGWAGPITLNTGIRVSTGGSLEFSGAIGGPGGITFAGSGDYIYSGSGYNIYLGDTVVEAGTLYLDKTPNGDRALPGPGDLYVGDWGDAPETVAVRWLGGYQVDEDVAIVTVPGGLADLNGFNDGVGELHLMDGDIRTGSGTISPYGNISATDTNNYRAPTIYGNLNLGAATRTINVDGPGGSYSLRHRDGVMSGSGGFVKTGPGDLTLWSSNTFAGVARVAEGELYVGDDHALGDPTDGTVIQDGAKLSIRDQRIDDEPLTLHGHGPAGGGALYTPIFDVTNRWDGPITLGSDTTIAVRHEPGDMLILGGVIDGPGSLTVQGGGTLVLSGPSPNSFTGGTIVNEGTLQLDKSGGNAIQYGSLTIGNGLGDSVIVLETDDFQIGTIPVIINEDGWLDLGDHYDTVGDITLHGGRISSSASGTLALGGDVSVPRGGSYISGNMSLGSALRTFDVPESGGMPIGDAHLGIYADVSGSSGMVKTGDGAMSLSGSNTFSGTVTVEEGELLPKTFWALGSATAGTVVQADAGVWLYPAPFSAALHIGDEPLLLRGKLLAAGARGTNEWAGPITLDGVATVSVGTDCILNLPGAIDGSGGMIKDRRGSLILSGPGANTYSGDTRVNEGVLELAKSAAGGGAIEGDLFIGDGIGGVDADVVRLKIGGQIDTAAGVTIAESGLLDLDGRPAAIGSLAGDGHVSLGSGDLAAGMDNSSTVFSGVIEGSGLLDKWGSGTFTLDGSNTYSGTTRIGAGTLLVNGWQPSSDVYVWEAGRLGGIGTVGAVDCIGVVSPGTSVGQLNCSEVSLGSGLGHSTLEMELDGHTPAGHDRLHVDGGVAISGSELAVSWGFVPAVGDTFTIIDNDGADPVVGTFNGLPENGSLTAGNVTLYITYAGGDGNDVVLGATEVVPIEKLRFHAIGCARGDALLQWEGGVPFYQVNKKVSLGTNTLWQPVGPPTRDFQIGVPMDTDEGYYQVMGGH